MNAIRYRWIDGPALTPEQWKAETETIERVLAARGWMSLNQMTSRVLVAEGESGELIGFFCLQLIPHVEPMFVVPSMRASDVAETLADKMLEFMQQAQARGWMLCTDNPLVARMAEARGMEQVKAKVFAKVS